MYLLVSIFALAAACVSVQGNKLFFMQKSSGVTLLVGVDESSATCEIITNKNDVDKVLKSDGAHVRTVSKEKMEKLMRFCAEEQRSRSENEVGYNGVKIIFPGTNWCGTGDIAENYDDLGSEADTDKCCRTHDHCDDMLLAGESRYNLTNDSKFTKLSCKCDNEFYDCLKNVNSLTSFAVGNMYFNYLDSECYQKDYPDSSTCKKRSFAFWGEGDCVQYEKDTTKEQKYQWTPPKDFPTFPSW